LGQFCDRRFRKERLSMNEAEYQAEVQRWLKYVQEDLRAAESFLSKKLFVNKGFDPPKSPLSRAGLQTFGSVPSLLRRVREDLGIECNSAIFNLIYKQFLNYY